MSKAIQDLSRDELEEQARVQQDEIDDLKDRFEQLTGQVDRLQRKLSRAGKYSSTSAKPPSSKQWSGRNDPCHCGSGRKYKKCCLPYER